MTDPAPSTHQDLQVASAVDFNTRLLEKLLDQVGELREVVDQTRPESTAENLDEHPECEQLREQITDLENQVRELEQQNDDLASQVASSNIRQTVSAESSSCNDALSWEDRKKLILQQMEDESFDADEFVANLQPNGESETFVEGDDPIAFVEKLNRELELRDAEITRRDDELAELRFLLEQQSETREGNVAIGAAAIAEMIDSDELVQQERERLQELQAEWEEKFREGEIAASLERAKLSRERQELANKQAELEEQLEHLRRESQQSQEHGSGSSRKWLAKLGLAEDSQ